MATEAESMNEVGRGPGTSLRRDDSGETSFEETRENGIHKLTTVLPDGTIKRTIERTDPSTGITTRIDRHPDGRVERATEWPGGQTQTTISYPDGTMEGHRAFKGPDGSEWRQSVDKDGRLVTAHDSYDADGTFRETVKKADGTVEVTTTKTFKLDDDSTMVQRIAPNGEITTKVTHPDGTSETSTLFADGKRELVEVTRTPDGKLVTQTQHADGTSSSRTEWTTPDGHQHRTVVDPDGSTRTFEDWEDRLPDGSTVQHHVGPGGTETITNRPDGSFERVKEHADGTTSTFTRTKEADGTIVERQQRADGSVRDARFTQNADGSFSTQTRDFDGTERTTMVGPDGRVEVTAVNPDGSRVESSFSSDGSGRTDTFNAQGHITDSRDVTADPNPVPQGGYDPETFINTALRELPADVAAAAIPPAADAPPDFPAPPVPDRPAQGEAAPTTPAEPQADADGTTQLDRATLERIAERGIVPPGDLEVASTPTGTPAPGMPIGTGAATGEEGRAFGQGVPGPTYVSERLADGTQRDTMVDPQGTMITTLKRTDPSTGITTEVQRDSTGRLETTVRSPGGATQTIIRHPDGSQETSRAFQGPDGTWWSQSTDKDGRVYTRHETFDPDGTHRTTEKQPDGRIEVTRYKETFNKDGSSSSVTTAPDGSVSTMVVQANGDSEMRTVSPDGATSTSAITRMPDGSVVSTLTDSNGAVTKTVEWTTPDGHHHTSTVRPDGTSETSEVWGEVRADGSSYTETIGPEGSSRIDYHADGSIDHLKKNLDGTTETYKLTKNPDGSAVEKHVLPDGSTRETHYSAKSPDGSYTTVSKEFDGTEHRTTMDESGRLTVHEQRLDGTRSETTYNPDGSGRTVAFDAGGNVTSETPIDPTPTAAPRDFDPTRFYSDAQSHLPDVPTIAPSSAPPEAGSRMLSDAEVAELSGRGIAPMGQVAATDLDNATVGEALTGTPRMYEEPGEVRIPAGALGNKEVVGDSVAAASVSPFDEDYRVGAPDPWAQDHTLPDEERVPGLEPEVERDIDPTPVDGSGEDITTPEPYVEEKVWPDEEGVDMEPEVGPESIGPDPAVENPEP